MLFVWILSTAQEIQLQHGICLMIGKSLDRHDVVRLAKTNAFRLHKHYAAAAAGAVRSAAGATSAGAGALSPIPAIISLNDVGAARGARATG